MKVVGIDASTNKTGIAVFEDKKYVDVVINVLYCDGDRRR